MRRLSTHNKVTLKDGKYILQQRQLKEADHSMAESGEVSNISSPRQQNIKTVEAKLKSCLTPRLALPLEMTSSAIYPRKIEYVPKHFTSRKVSQVLRDSVENSPAKGLSMHRDTSGLLTTRNRQVSFKTLPAGAKSHEGSEVNYDAQMESELPMSKSIIECIRNLGEPSLDSNVEELKSANKELTDKLRQYEFEKSARLSPEKEIVWLRKNLAGRTEEYQKTLKDNTRLQNELRILRQKVESLAITNHILQVENAKNKAQLLTEEEVAELCCPQKQKGTFVTEDNPISHIEGEIERLKADISGLGPENKDGKLVSQSLFVRSQVVAEHSGQSRQGSMKKNIFEKISILEAAINGYEKKQSLRKYITNLVIRLESDQQMMIQLRRQLETKQEIIKRMDSFITDISQQLASTKKELAKQLELQMGKSIQTSTSLAASGSEKDPSSLANSRYYYYSESPIVKRTVRFSQQIQDSRFNETPSQRRNERMETMESEIVDDTDFIIKKLEMECSDKQKLVEKYKYQIMRLSRMMGAESDSIKPKAVQYSQNETDLNPTLQEMGSSLQVKRKQIGGQNSKASVISIKRAC